MAPLCHSRGRGRLVDVGRSDDKGSDDPRPADTNMKAEAVKGLEGEDVFPEGCLSFEVPISRLGRMRVMAEEEVVDGFIPVQAEVFSHDLHGAHLAISRGWFWPPAGAGVVR